MLSPEIRLKVSAALKGRSLSTEAKAKMRLAKLGGKHTPEHNAKIGQSSKGRRHSAEVRVRMSIAQRGTKKSHGWWSTEEGRAKQKLNNHGNQKPRSPETRAKISASIKALMTEEHRAEISRMVIAATTIEERRAYSRLGGILGSAVRWGAKQTAEELPS